MDIISCNYFSSEMMQRLHGNEFAVFTQNQKFFNACMKTTNHSLQKTIELLKVKTLVQELIV